MIKKVLAVILARGGSKGILDKNLSNLNGKPLLYFTISEAKKSSFISNIILSSDSDKIIEYAHSQNIQTLKRSSVLSSDTTTSEDSLLDAVKKSIDDGLKFDYILLLQPTSPFRKVFHINESIEKIFSDPEINSLVSICKSNINPNLFKKIVGNNYIQPILKGLKKQSYPHARQNFNNVYYINGAIYIVKKDFFLKTGSLYDKKNGYYLMNEISSIDIDEPLDLELANYLLQKKELNVGNNN